MPCAHLLRVAAQVRRVSVDFGLETGGEVGAGVAQGGEDLAGLLAVRGALFGRPVVRGRLEVADPVGELYHPYFGGLPADSIEAVDHRCRLFEVGVLRES